MPLNRFYLSENFVSQSQLSIENEEFHHLCHVVRCQAGDIVELFNGNGDLAQAIIEKVDKKRALLKLLEVNKSLPPPYELILVQAMPRANRLDFILEKGTELGVTQFVLFPAEFSERKLQSEEQLKKLEHHLIAAAKQSGRLYLPQLTWLKNLSLWSPPPSALAFFGSTDPQALPLKNFENSIAKHSKLVFFIGPESGFHPKEIQLFHEWHCLGVRLNPHILRTETAAITALSLLSHYKHYDAY